MQLAVLQLLCSAVAEGQPVRVGGCESTADVLAEPLSVVSSDADADAVPQLLRLSAPLVHADALTDPVPRAEPLEARESLPCAEADGGPDSLLEPLPLPVAGPAVALAALAVGRALGAALSVAQLLSDAAVEAVPAAKLLDCCSVDAALALATAGVAVGGCVGLALGVSPPPPFPVAVASLPLKLGAREAETGLLPDTVSLLVGALVPLPHCDGGPEAESDTLLLPERLSPPLLVPPVPAEVVGTLEATLLKVPAAVLVAVRDALPLPLLQLLSEVDALGERLPTPPLGVARPVNRGEGVAEPVGCCVSD